MACSIKKKPAPYVKTKGSSFSHLGLVAGASTDLQPEYFCFSPADGVTIHSLMCQLTLDF